METDKKGNCKRSHHWNVALKELTRLKSPTFSVDFLSRSTGHNHAT